ncbi:PepSY domain-containing protein [Nocardioides carbamazepini]|uniref:PepSY domain-containing protein n=1 Tax=Nocardioides carbamazepini TaxID=2854259 RepID=UPI0021499F3E|nr:PepSY domain-containing protein [Nocardioides carbamazepini]MCR1782993.1 PepSY domain-containing protein [Nocardioides carbamazepini]
MNISILRRKRIILPTLAAVAVIGAGGVFWAASADDVSGGERDRVAAAAVEAAGGGEAVDVEKSDDPGEAYEVEVRLADGTEVDITLDQDLAVLTRDRDDDRYDDRDDDRYDDRDDDRYDDRDGVDGVDADDRILSDAERASAEQAALAAVGGGTVLDVDPSDDPGVAYEAEVRDAAGVEWDVDLDTAFAVVAKVADN